MTSRRVWLTADQGISSLSNLLIAVIVAHRASRHGYGEFALMFSAYWLCIGGLRAFICEPTLIMAQSASGSGDVDQNLIWRAPVASTLIAAVLGTIAFTTGTVFGGLLHGVGTLGYWLPFLAAQDAFRYVQFALGKPWRAFCSDATWAGCLLLGTFLTAGQHLTLSSMIDVWACSATISLVPVLAWASRPTLGRLRETLTPNPTLSFQMLAEFAVGSGAQQAVLFLVPAVAGVLAVASLKAGQVAVGPLNVLATATAVAALPRLSQAFLRNEIPSMLPIALRFTSLNAFLGVAYALVLLVLPASIGVLVVGPNWASSRIVAVLTALQVALIAVSQGAMFALQASRNVAQSLRVRVAMFPATLTFALLGAWCDGALGTALGLVAASTIECGLWWRMAVRVLRPSQTSL